jgi:hypothetical protein
MKKDTSKRAPAALNGLAKRADKKGVNYSCYFKKWVESSPALAVYFI